MEDFEYQGDDLEQQSDMVEELWKELLSTFVSSANSNDVWYGDWEDED